MRCKLLSMLAMLASALCSAQPQTTDSTFAPFEQWKAAVLAQDASALKAMYSTDPAAQIRVNTTMHPADADINFWLALKAKSIKVGVVRNEGRHGHISFIFRAEVVTGLPNGQTVTVTEDQAWQQQGEQWRLMYVERTDSPRLPQPENMKKDLYPADVDAHAEIKEAEEKAAREHKRILLVVGANWCFDCHVLDLSFHRTDIAPIVNANYKVVHLDIGPDGKKNADVLKEFDISLNKGVPVVVVSESDGKVVVNEKNGEFEDARQLTPEFLLEFLNKWKPPAR